MRTCVVLPDFWDPKFQIYSKKCIFLNEFYLGYTSDVVE